MDVKDLIKKAIEAKQMAYAPYSKFKVGCALLCKEGTIYTGCNIENAAYSPTNCAERTAFFKAISEGIYDFTAIAIIGGEGEYCYPCGVCRQVMQEFCDAKYFKIIIAKDLEQYRIHTLVELLPYGFNKKDLIN